MSDETEHPVLEYLHRIDVRTEQFEANLAQTLSKMSAMRTDMVVLYHLMERCEDRLERIEKRLDLAPA